MKRISIKIFTLVIAAALLNSCGDGQSDTGGRSSDQVQCAVTEILANGLCSACAINEVTINNRCVACASNEINVNNSCIACADNEITVNNMCVACASDEIVQNNMCVSCASNEIIQNGICVACGANEQVVNGQCQLIPVVASPSCPSNSSLSGSSCSCAPNYRAAGTAVGAIGSTCAVYPGDANHSGGVQAPNSCSGCHSVRVRSR